jgi:hypothetical protein
MHHLVHERLQQPPAAAALAQRADVHACCRGPARDHVCEARQRVGQRALLAVPCLVGRHKQHQVVALDAAALPQRRRVRVVAEAVPAVVGGLGHADRIPARHAHLRSAAVAAACVSACAAWASAGPPGPATQPLARLQRRAALLAAPAHAHSAAIGPAASTPVCTFSRC